MTRSIDQLSVVEIAGSPAGGYAGRLFAGWGAHVQRAELAAAPPRRDTALELYLDHAKITHTVDGTELARLLDRADVVIESSAPEPLRPRSVPRPGLVRIEISPSPHGAAGGRRWSTELTDLAASGHLLLNGDPDREPLNGPRNQVSFAAGLHGFIGAAAAIYGGRERAGTTVEVNHLQVMASLHQFTLIRRLNGGDLLRRMGNRWAGPGSPCGLYPCLDGHVAIIVPRDDQLERLLAVSDLVHLLAEPGIEHAYDLMHHPTLLDEHLRPWFARQRMLEVVETLQEVRVAVAPVSTMVDILRDPHLGERNSLVELDGVRIPAAPAQLSGIEWCVRPPDSQAARGPAPPPLPKPTVAKPRPLAGLRVVDLTRVWAGPLATRILADLGADVTMIEAPWARGGPTIDDSSVRATAYYPDNDPGEDHWNRIGFVNKYALGKRSVALDLSHGEGRVALEGLIRTADVVIENYSPRVMPQLGLDERRLAELQPDLVYVTMPGYGRTGPASDRVAYGPVIDAHAGLSVLMGYEGEAARSAGVAWPDPIAGLHAVAATLVALLRRRVATGFQVVEIAQLEATLAMVGAALAEYQIAESEPVAMGNRDHRWSPQAVLPCVGQDRWVAVTVADDSGWRHVCRAVGLPGLADLTLTQRRERQPEIEAALARWTADRTQAAVVDRLSTQGVAVAPVADAQQVLDHPDLEGSWAITEHPSSGRECWPRTPIVFDGEPLEPARSAPRLGEHNRALFDETDLPSEAYDHLVTAGIITTSPPD